MKIAVVSQDEKQLADLVRLLHDRTPKDEVVTFRGALERLTASPDPGAPAILILDQSSLPGLNLDGVERLGQLYPGMACILLCPLPTPELLLQAMRAGVREVLAAGAVFDELMVAIRRIEDKMESAGKANGKVLAFVSCKGGSGATFLATNLGYALATAEQKRVVLIDLNMQWGDASLFVSDHKPPATLADVAQQINRLDASFLAASMLNIAPNFGILAAPEDPAHADEVKPEHVDLILKLARRRYDFVLIDVGSSLDAVSIRGLDQADMIFPILQTTLPYIRDGKRLLGIFRALDYRKEKIHLVVNRHEKTSEIRIDDLETAYGAKIYRSIPNHYEAAAASVNQGVPVVKLAPASPISAALLDFAHALCGSGVQLKQGWLSRLLTRESERSPS